MPSPYDYRIQPADISGALGAYSAGRGEREQAQKAERQKMFGAYLPDALKGNEDAQKKAYSFATPEQTLQLSQHLQSVADHDLAQKRDQQKQIASLAQWADTPEKWAQAVSIAEADGMNGASGIPFEQRGAVIARVQSMSDMLEQEWKRRSFGLQERAQSETERHNRAIEGSQKNTGYDPATGRRVAPPNIQSKDYNELAKAQQSADAAASIANTLRSVAPALSRIDTGPGTGAARSIAGAFSVAGDVLSPVTSMFGAGDLFGDAKTFTANYDAIEQASKTIGIDTLQKVGGSDTERELATAISTTVNADTRPEENARRFKNQLIAADILSRKAQLMTEWINRFGSLSYAADNGSTWSAFWSEYQKSAWADSQKPPPGQTGGNYRDEQRRLLNGGQPPKAVPPPGFQLVK